MTRRVRPIDAAEDVLHAMWPLACSEKEAPVWDSLEDEFYTYVQDRLGLKPDTPFENKAQASKVKEEFLREMLKRGIQSSNASRRNPREPQTIRPQPARGSVATAETLVALVPLAAKMRQKLLGQAEPLTRKEAVAWLLKEDAKDGSRSMSLRLELLVDESLWRSELFLRALTEPAAAAQVVGSAPRVSGGLMRYPSLDGWSVDLDRNVQMNHDGLQVLARMVTGKSDPQFAWAMGSTSSDLAESCGSFMAACWFVLTGYWPGPGVKVAMKMMPRPAIVLDIGETEVTGAEVKTLYEKERRDFRQIQANLRRGKASTPKSGRGKPLSQADVQLWQVALETLHLDDVTGRGFNAAVLKRWQRRAPELVARAEAFTTVDQVRKALRRVERRCGVTLAKAACNPSD